MNYKAAIFDFDGTLCNTLPDIAAAGNHALAALGFPGYSVPEYRYFVGEGVVRLMERILPEGHRDAETVEKLRGIYGGYYTEHIDGLTAPYAGISELLEALAARGVRLAVLSNKDDPDTKKLAQEFFPGRFAAVYGVRPGVPRKPAPEAPLALAAEFGVAPKEVLFIGDSKFDIETARNAGMDSCGVLWGFRDRAELEAAGATHVVTEPNEILSLF